ncbi:uncharacterized protein LOC128882993 [Hylaeus volcanicus]|uniref:uncharacterized protein LOC128882993 n=1 Tax=Hylaeus volcanicus TaxID=313075 RepID=UPI0023B7BA9F|nr:uncharacterized protein LOC128882993 [Hylaeus volcanicus]
METFTTDIITFLNQYRDQVSSFKNKPIPSSQDGSLPKDSKTISEVENMLDNGQKTTLEKRNMRKQDNCESNDMMSVSNDTVFTLKIKHYSTFLWAHQIQLFVIIVSNKNFPKYQFTGSLSDCHVTFQNVNKNTLVAKVPSQNPQECCMTLTAYDYINQKQKRINFLLKQHETCQLITSLPVTVIPNCGLTLSSDNTTACRNSLHYKRISGSIKLHNNTKTHTLSKQPLITRLKELRQWKRHEPLRELSLALVSLDSTLTQSGIPFNVRATIYHSVPSINRDIISQFHQQLFEIQPFRMYCLHLFTKSHPEEVYSIFSFTLRQEASSNDSKNPMFVSSLERFDAYDRACCDPRYWTFLDELVPMKNEAAHDICSSPLQQSPPLPELLRDAFSGCVTSGCYSKEPSLQIAPHVFLYWDVWPNRILPNESNEGNKVLEIERKARTMRRGTSFFDSFDAILHANQIPDDEVGQSESTGCTGIPLPTEQNKTENKEKAQMFLEEHPTPSNKDNKNQDPLLFGITLCVEDRIYTSVTGVSQKMLHYVVKHWLSFTPYEKDFLQRYQLVQQQAYPSFFSSSHF